MSVEFKLICCNVIILCLMFARVYSLQLDKHYENIPATTKVKHKVIWYKSGCFDVKIKNQFIYRCA